MIIKNNKELEKNIREWWNGEECKNMLKEDRCEDLGVVFSYWGGIDEDSYVVMGEDKFINELNECIDNEDINGIVKVFSDNIIFE